MNFRRGIIKIFFSEKSGSRYLLKDSSFPGASETVITERGTDGRYYSSSDSASSGWDPAAVSAVSNAKLAYDYFSKVHDHDSYDGAGSRIDILVNSGDCNAAWYPDIRLLELGKGSAQCDAKNFAISLDVMTHELTHGVVSSTSNLAYRNESGAIDESFSDFFGAMVDRDDWLIGDTLSLSGTYTRSMINPTSQIML